MPQRSARDRIEAEDFAVTRRQDFAVLDNYIDKIVALETRRPHLLTGGAVQRDDRPFDT